MSESQQDEHQLDRSAIASRQNMTTADWLQETIQDGYLLDDLDPIEFTQEIIDIFKSNYLEPGECGYRLADYIGTVAERVSKQRVKEFENEREDM